MRTKALLGVGLALWVGGVAAGQPLAPPPIGGYVPPAGGLQPASAVVPAPLPSLPTSLEIKSALGADHPWLIKPEHGPFFIMVKSYVRPAPGRDGKIEDGGLTAKALAEGLASEIRDAYRVQAFLFEYVSEERKAEMRQIAAARQKAQVYYAQLGALKKKSELQGREFLEPDKTFHVMTHSHRDQIGVLVGGFETEADAKTALAKLKTWPTPKNEVLCDKGAIVQPGADGKPEVVKAAINPYAGAFVVPNPAVARAAPAGPKGLDPFIVKLNDDNPYSLLKATKGWTLGVKSYTAPVQITNKDSDTSLMRKMGLSKGANALAAGGEQAEEMAAIIRKMKGPAGADGRGGQALNLEAFVLHTRYASLVTVGQFDGPDDPALHATKRLLSGITATVGKGQTATALFDNMVAMPIPKP